MRKLSTLFVTAIVVAIAVTSTQVHATTFTPPADSLVMRVLPNPTVDVIKIDALDKSVDLTNAKIVIYSAHGEKIFTRQFADGVVNLNTISRYPVKAGIYYVTVINETGKVFETVGVLKF